MAPTNSHYLKLACVALFFILFYGLGTLFHAIWWINLLISFVVAHAVWRAYSFSGEWEPAEFLRAKNGTVLIFMEASGVSMIGFIFGMQSGFISGFYGFVMLTGAFMITLPIAFWLLAMASALRLNKRRTGVLAISAVAEYQIGMGSERMRRYETRIIRTPTWRPLNMDLKEYLDQKANHNVFVCGASGSGKSRLMNYLLQLYDDEKYIFSFKPRDEYLDVGIEIVDMSKHLPNAFTNPDDFVAAFLITYSMSDTGITAASLSSLLTELAKGSRNWNDFEFNVNRRMASGAGSIKRNALTFIADSAKQLKSDLSGFELPEGKSLVFDFSKLNENAKTFYAELILRNLFRGLTTADESKKSIICVDEAHRLLGSLDRHHSIFFELAREIRTFGSLWTSSQNYTDLPASLVSQFQTAFFFAATAESDLSAFAAIDQKVAYAAVDMPKHCFSDARYPGVHDVVPELILDWEPKLHGRRDFECTDKPAAASGSGDSWNWYKRMYGDLLGERPTTTQHAAILAIYGNKSAKITELASYVRSKGWISGSTTIYGGSGRPGVFESLVMLGLAARSDGGRYELTQKGSSWVNPNMILDSVNTASDLHFRLLKRTIAKLHESNTLVIAPKGHAVPDLIAYPMESGKRKYMWKDSAVRAYEIQTTARADNVMSNKSRNDKDGLNTVWVTYDGGIMAQIKKLTGGDDEYVIVNL